MCDKELQDFVYSVKKFPDEFPQELIKAINLISNNKDDIGIMGSFRQKSLIFSADIDCLEIIPLDKQANALIKIVKKIIDDVDYNKKIFIGDIKCGNNKYHPLLNYIGSIKNNKIVGYSLESIKLHLINDYIPELSNLPLEPTVEEWLKIKKFVSSLIAIRWKPNEILSKSKKINQDFIDLDFAVYNSNTTKIDIIYNYYGKFTEISNIIYSEMQSKDYFVRQIRENMMYNIYNNNILKGLKNAYSIARIKDDCDILRKISPILISPVNSLSSCKSDLTVLTDSLDFGLKLYYHRFLISSHIGTIILKLATYYLDDLPTDIFHEINSLIDLYDDKKFKEKIEYINDLITEITNKNSIEYIKKNNINIKKYSL